jgi:hypothetical protein
MGLEYSDEPIEAVVAPDARVRLLRSVWIPLSEILEGRGVAVMSQVTLVVFVTSDGAADHGRVPRRGGGTPRVRAAFVK